MPFRDLPELRGIETGVAIGLKVLRGSIPLGRRGPRETAGYARTGETLRGTAGHGVDEAGFPSFNEPRHPSRAVGEEQLVGPKGQLGGTVHPEVVRPLVSLLAIKFPVQRIVVPGAGKSHGLCPGIAGLRAKPMYGPHGELNLHGMVVISGEVAIEVRGVSLRISNKIVFREA